MLAFFAGGGGLIGTFMGGYMGDKFGNKDKRWYLLGPAIAIGLATPLAFPYLLLDNVNTTIALLFIFTLLTNTFLGSCLAISHTLAPPAMRALTSAILFFVLNLIGLGLGPIVTGLLSDYFTNIYGEEGLRYAMLIVAMAGIPSVWFYLMAAKHLPADLDKKLQLLHQDSNIKDGFSEEQEYSSEFK